MGQPDADRPVMAHEGFVRDPLADPQAVLAARERSMAERLELAISWNRVASELRAGMTSAIERPRS